MVPEFEIFLVSSCDHGEYTSGSLLSRGVSHQWWGILARGLQPVDFSMFVIQNCKQVSWISKSRVRGALSTLVRDKRLVRALGTSLRSWDVFCQYPPWLPKFGELLHEKPRSELRFPSLKFSLDPLRLHVSLVVCKSCWIERPPSKIPRI